MDVYVEQLVTKNDKSVAIKKIFVIAAVIIVCILIPVIFLSSDKLMMWIPIGFFLDIGAVFGGYKWLQSLRVEYEYLFTNGDLDIDKIIAKSSRKRITSLTITSLEEFGKYKGAETNGDKKVLDLRGKTGDVYFADYNSKDNGKMRILFTPDDRLIQAINPYLRRIHR